MVKVSFKEMGTVSIDGIVYYIYEHASGGVYLINSIGGSITKIEQFDRYTPKPLPRIVEKAVELLEERLHARYPVITNEVSTDQLLPKE